MDGKQLIKDSINTTASLSKKAASDAKGLLDNIFARVISRKLAVWGVASWALFSGVVTSSDWVAISLAYIGSQAAVDLASKWKSS